jgi:hypothetical protein
MAFPTDNELEPTNQILMSIGQAPVTTLDQTNPDVAIAYNTLLEVSREVQAEGWAFNREYDVTFTPDTDDYILIASNIIRIDLNHNPTNASSNAKTNSVIRTDISDNQRKLYDKYDHTFKWTGTTYKCDVVYKYDWIDIPVPVQDYITSRAATVASSRIVGDPQQYRLLQQKEALAKATALEYECDQGDYSYFGFPRGRNYHATYKPYEVLTR